MNFFANQSIVVERDLGSILSDFRIYTIFDYIGWQNLFHLKNPTYPQLIRITSHLQNIQIELDCDTLGNILGINNEGHRVYEVKIYQSLEILCMMRL
jgi:hypothetical protein